jgi:hypothetical protein
MLHPTELRCTLRAMLAPFWAKLHPSKLRCTLLSYDAPYWATLDPNWATLHPKYIPPPHRSFTVPFGKINIIKRNSCVGKNPRKCSTALGLRWTLLSNTATKLMICRENPGKCPSLAENPSKYTTAYIVQQSNCRWHCEPTFFLSWAFNKEKSVHTLPLESLHLLSLHLYPSLSKPSISSPWSVWLLKHKE